MSLLSLLDAHAGHGSGWHYEKHNIQIMALIVKLPTAGARNR